MQGKEGKSSFQYDYVFLATVFGLAFFGLIMLASASGPLAFQKFKDGYYFVRHQLLSGIIPGMLFFLFMFLVDIRLWQRTWKWLYAGTVILLLLPFVPGIGNDYGTAQSWIHIGSFGFQTSELAKISFIMALAGWLQESGTKATHAVKEGLGVFTFGLGLVLLLLVLQPDIGGLTVYATIALGMYWMAGAKVQYMLGLIVAACAAVFALIKAKPYRADRFMVFLHPEMDPQGAGYHINQAIMTIGSGGWFGEGFGHSRQKYQYLPEVAGDSIFAIMAEELGFFVCVALIIAFLFLLLRMHRIAEQAKNPWARLVVMGIATWVTFQAFVNIGSMVSIMPMTGITLPFISYGGSSLTVLLGAMGLVYKISHSKKPRTV